MVRAFDPRPVPDAVRERLLSAALRAPTAGNCQGVELLALVGATETARYWDVSLPVDRRASFGWPRLLDAPLLVLVLADPSRYVDRYGEPDKSATGLGADVADWPVPYWWVDAGMAVQALLLGAVDAGLGACFFGLFDREAAVRAALAVPDHVVVAGTVAVGLPAGDDRPGRSAGRPRRPAREVVHRGRWAGADRSAGGGPGGPT